LEASIESGENMVALTHKTNISLQILNFFYQLIVTSVFLTKYLKEYKKYFLLQKENIFAYKIKQTHLIKLCKNNI